MSDIARTIKITLTVIATLLGVAIVITILVFGLLSFLFLAPPTNQPSITKTESKIIRTKEERRVFTESFKTEVNKKIKLEVSLRETQNEILVLRSEKLSSKEIKNGLNKKVLSGLHEFGFKQIAIESKNNQSEIITIV